MDRQIANEVTPLGNVPSGVFDKYIEYRVDKIRTSMESADTLETLNRLKGQLAEVRRLAHLREEIKTALES